jgi:hypothetical protein
MIRILPSCLPALLISFVTPSLWAEPSPKIVGHLQNIIVQKQFCPSAPVVFCNAGESGLQVQGLVSQPYTLYLYVVDADTSTGVASASFGIEYGPNLFVNTWRLCADLDFTGGGWPASGSGIVATWDPTANCQQSAAPGDAENNATVLIGALYVYAYDTELLQIGKRAYLPQPDISIVDCALVENAVLFPEYAGQVAFGDTSGYDPCYADTLDLLWSVSVSWPESAQAKPGAFVDQITPVLTVDKNSFSEGIVNQTFPISSTLLTYLGGNVSDLPLGEAPEIVSRRIPVKFNPDGTVSHVYSPLPSGSVVDLTSAGVYYVSSRPVAGPNDWVRVPLPEHLSTELSSYSSAPFGNWGVATTRNEEIVIHSLSRGEVRRIEATLSQLVFSQEESKVALLTSEDDVAPRRLLLYDSDGRLIFERDRIKNAVTFDRVAFSGSNLFFTELVNGMRVPYVMDTEGGSAPLQLQPLPSGLMVFSRNGSHLGILEYKKAPWRNVLHFYSIEDPSSPQHLWTTTIFGRHATDLAIGPGGGYTAIQYWDDAHKDFSLTVFSEAGTVVLDRKFPRGGEIPMTVKFVGEDLLVAGIDHRWLSPSTDRIVLYRLSD